MVRKKEEARKETLEVYVSPSWKLQRQGSEIKFIAPVCLPYEKEGLVKVEITVEEV